MTTDDPHDFTYAEALEMRTLNQSRYLIWHHSPPSAGGAPSSSSGLIPNTSASRRMLMKDTTVSPRSARVTVARANPALSASSLCPINFLTRHSRKWGSGSPRVFSAINMRLLTFNRPLIAVAISISDVHTSISNVIEC